MDPALAEIGATANNYQVLAKLATGGMAEIFLARSVGVAAVQRYVVLKRVLREHARDVTFVRMFLEEARLAAQLQHANIAQVYDAGKLGDSYFFTMEYVHGETVRTMLQRAHELRRSPPINCVLATIAGAAAGLHHAHERIGIEGRPLGIVHRDVSPSNLMIGYDGSVKVVDFGVAKTTDRAETKSGAVKGKISYLSPEQARGQRLDRRSDVFSLGIVMWEMLTVERLYKRANDFDAMSSIIHDPPPAPSLRRHDIPVALDAIVMRALAKDPADRFQTAEEMGEAIDTIAGQLGATLAPASLSRFLRDLFGARPEPWIELRAASQAPDVVTVTSEPIPQELAIVVSDPIDRRLAAVKDLSVAGVAHAHNPFTRELSIADAEPETVTPTPRPALLPPAAWPQSMPPTAAPQPRRFGTAIVIGVAIVLAAIVAAVLIGTSRGALAPAAPQPVATPSPPDAPVVVAEIVVDAALPDAAAPDAAPEAAIEEAVLPVKKPLARKPAKKPSTVATLFAARAYHQAVQACIDDMRTDRGICAQAACLAGDEVHAKKWYAKASPRAGAIERACKANGIRVGKCTDLYECPD